MLHCIQIFTNTCEVKMQVKRAIEKAILHKLRIYNEYVFVYSLCIILHVLLFVFPIVVKALLHGFDHYIRSLYNVVPASFLCARTPRNAMSRSIEICLL